MQLFENGFLPLSLQEAGEVSIQWDVLREAFVLLTLSMLAPCSSEKIQYRYTCYTQPIQFRRTRKNHRRAVSHQ
jgi:hypothetical protein